MARLLIIEDEKDLLKVLEFNLRQAGHEVLDSPRAGATACNSRASTSPIWCCST